MPNISEFHGIKTGRVLRGRLPAGKLRLVLKWLALHRAELLRDWELASTGKTTFQIEPLC